MSQTNQHPPLELYDLRLPEIPARSILYSLVPIGIGTPMVESLTSYLIRLAYEHCVLPGVLITTSIAPVVNPEAQFHGHQRNIREIWGGDHANTSICNGMQSTAANITRILKQLTQRNDLHLLTMLPWAEVIAFMRLLQNKRTWCPSCYADWSKTNQVLYEPLIWSFKAVTICPIHHQLLLQSCPHCGQTSRLLTTTSLPPGRCSKCGGWLGSISKPQAPLASTCALDLKQQSWIVQVVGELLAKTPSLCSCIPRTRIKAVLKAYVERVTHGNINELSRFIQQPDSTLYNWVQGKSVPQLTQLLKLCNSLQISLWNFFTQPIEEIPFSSLGLLVPASSQRSQPKQQKRLNATVAQAVLRTALHELPPPSRREVIERLQTERSTLQRRFPELSHAISTRHAEYQRTQKSEALQQKLKSIIATEEPPPSLREVARRLGTTTVYLRTYCLDLCDTITERHASYVKNQGKQTQTDIQQQVRQIVLELHSIGVNPTNGAVSQRMSQPARLRTKSAQEMLKMMRSELGY